MHTPIAKTTSSQYSSIGYLISYELIIVHLIIVISGSNVRHGKKVINHESIRLVRVIKHPAISKAASWVIKAIILLLVYFESFSYYIRIIGVPRYSEMMLAYSVVNCSSDMRIYNDLLMSLDYFSHLQKDCFH